MRNRMIVAGDAGPLMRSARGLASPATIRARQQRLFTCDLYEPRAGSQHFRDLEMRAGQGVVV